MSQPDQRNTFTNLTAGAMTFGHHSPATGHVVHTVPAAQPTGDMAEAVSSVLLVVVAHPEREAVLAAVQDVTGARWTRRFLPHHTIYELGRIGGTDVLLAQVAQGSVTPDSAGAGAGAGELITALRPDHVILTGICYGLKDDDRRRPQQLGDVLVANQLRLIAHHKFARGADGHELRLQRGGAVHPSPALLDRLQSAALDWRNPAAVHVGPMLSESVLVDSADYRARLKAAEPEAIGGEMEGAPFYAAAVRAKVNWALVKGISDWAYGKGDGHQQMAADNAASLVVHMLRTGGLDPVRGR